MRRPSCLAVASAALAISSTLLVRSAAACPCPNDAVCPATCDEEIDPARDRLGVRLDLWRVTPTIDGLGGNGSSVFGVGTSLYGRVNERVALELGFDLGAGKGASGLGRYEVSFRFPDVLVYFNPRSTTQLYLRTGITHAIVAYEPGDATFSTPSQTAFYYLGGVVGVGLQHFVSNDTALSVELRGIARARVDASDSDLATTNPDFHAATRVDSGVSLMVGWLAF